MSLSTRVGALGPLVVVALACAWVARLVSGVFDGGALLGDGFPLLASHVHELAEALRARDGGMWIHGANLGYPAGTFAPLLPSLLAAIAHSVGVDVHTAIKVALAVPLVLLPASLFAGLRALPLDGWRASVATGVCALSLSSSPYGLGIEGAFGTAALLDETWAVAILPLAAGLGVRAIVDGRRLMAALSTTILCGLLHPMVAASLVTVWIVAAGADRSRARVVRAVVLAALALVGTMVVWITPFATGAAHGAASDASWLSDAALGDSGFALLPFIRFLATILDHERTPLLSLLALVGVLVTAWHAVRTGRPSAGAGYVVVGALVSIALLVGPYLFRGALPLGRFAPLLQLSACVLAGIGVVDLVALVARATSSPVLTLVARAALAFSLAALVVIATTTQLRRAHELMRTIETDPTLAADLDVLRRVAREAAPPARVAAAGGLRTVSRHALAVEGWPGLWSSIGPSVAASAMAPFLSRTDVIDTVQITNTGLLLLPRDAPQSLRPRSRAPPTRAGRFHVYDTRGTSDRGYFLPVLLESEPAPAPAGEPTSFRDRSLRWWRTEGYRTGRHFVWRHTPAPAGKGRVNVLEESVAPSRFTAALDVATDGPRAVLLSVSWHPWWRAFVDGARVPALRVSPEMLAAEVAPGQHTLTFQFVRPVWWWLLWLMPLAAPAALRLMLSRSLRASRLHG